MSSLHSLRPYNALPCHTQCPLYHPSRTAVFAPLVRTSTPPHTPPASYLHPITLPCTPLLAITPLQPPERPLTQTYTHLPAPYILVSHLDTFSPQIRILHSLVSFDTSFSPSIHSVKLPLFLPSFATSCPRSWSYLVLPRLKPFPLPFPPASLLSTSADDPCTLTRPLLYRILAPPSRCPSLLPALGERLRYVTSRLFSLGVQTVRISTRRPTLAIDFFDLGFTQCNIFVFFFPGSQLCILAADRTRLIVLASLDIFHR